MNYCCICGERLGNVHPKNKKIALLYNSFSRGKMYSLSGFAHKKCVEENLDYAE